MSIEFLDLPNATPSSDGLMSAADKTKLDSLPADAATADHAHTADEVGFAPTAPITSDNVHDALLEVAGMIPGTATVPANTFMAGPVSGADATPTQRALVDADIPATIARDTEVTAAITTHNADTAAHGQTAVGRAVLTAADAAAARTAIGAGTGGGDMVSTNNLSDLANAATARTNLGLGTAATHAHEDYAAAGHTHGAAGVTGGTDGYKLASNGTSGVWEADYGVIPIVLKSATTLATGIVADIEVPFDCVIDRVTLLADQTGDIVIDIWRDTYANFPPTDADSITASAPPTITAGVKSQDTTLTGWTTTLAQGDILRVNIDSVTAITRVSMNLHVRKT